MKRKKKPTLREQLQPTLTEMRLAWMPFNEHLLIDGGRLAKVRAQRARLARRVLKRLARQQMLTKAGDLVTRSELRVLCGAALSDEANGKRRRR